MTIRLKNSFSGRVVEYATPEDIAPPHAVYPNKSAQARAEREAGRQRRMLDTLRRSSRWSETSEAVTPVSDRQRRASWEESERRRIEARLRAEYEQKLENERAQLTTSVGPVTSTPEQDEEPDTPEPSAAQVRAWAKDHGYDVPSRGKLPEDVVEAYKQAQDKG